MTSHFRRLVLPHRPKIVAAQRQKFPSENNYDSFISNSELWHDILRLLFAALLRLPLNEVENNVPTEKNSKLARFSPAELKRHEKQSKEKQKLGEQQENLPLRGLSMNFSSLVLVVWSCLASIHYWRCGLLTAERFLSDFSKIFFRRWIFVPDWKFLGNWSLISIESWDLWVLKEVLFAVLLRSDKSRKLIRYLVD